MLKILFICHGNICRSPMAESVMAYLIEREGLEKELTVYSSAAHRDELGDPPHRGTAEVLKGNKIPLVPHRANLLTEGACDEYDFLIGMDEANVRDIRRIAGERNKNKVYKLLDFTSSPRPIADPWYTGDFDKTFSDVWEGCGAFLSFLKEQRGIGRKRAKKEI